MTFRLLSVLFAAILLFPHAAAAGNFCSSSDACPVTQRCSTERGDCQSGCKEGEACLGVCLGVCENGRREGFFQDVALTHPDAEAILFLQFKNIIRGYPDGTFRPDTAVNRAEFLKILSEIHFLPVDTPSSAPHQNTPPNFLDVQYTDWFYDYVSWAFYKKLVDGYPDGTFKPEQGISFAEAAKILTREFIIPVKRSDVWFEGAVRSLSERSAIPVSINSFDQKITRAETAEMIWRLEENVRTKQSRTFEELEHPSNVFDPKEIHAGSRVGGMTVTNVRQLSADFEGSVTVTGRYSDSSLSKGEMGPHSVCMFNFTPESAAVLPLLDNKYGPGSFCFESSKLLYTRFPRGSRGTATVVLSGVSVTWFMEGSNMASFSEILDVNPE